MTSDQFRTAQTTFQKGVQGGSSAVGLSEGNKPKNDGLVIYEDQPISMECTMGQQGGKLGILM